MNVADSNIFREMCNYCQRFDLLDMVNDALILIDTQNGRFLFMNDKALEMYQYTKEESFKLSIADIRHDSVRFFDENMRAAMQYPKGYVFTANHMKKDGTIFKVEVSTRFMKMHGQEIFAAIVRNLTVDGKMREEVELAGKVQRRLLPDDLEEKLFCIRSIYQPYNYVSGDLYDFSFEENNKVLRGMIIDVMGHCISAAFQTNVLKYLFRKIMGENIPLSAKLAWMNKEVMPFFASGGFAGVFLFELDFKSNTLTYSAGGINHFIVLTEQGPEVIKAPGLFLGINQEEEFDEGVMPFQSGESFLFLTDGLFELLSQPLSSKLDFWQLQEMCGFLTSKGNRRDDATGVGILIS